MINIKQDKTHPDLNRLLTIIDEDYRTLRLFACRCAREVLPMLSEEDGWEEWEIATLAAAIDASERYARGEGTQSELLRMEDKVREIYVGGQEIALGAIGVMSWDDVRANGEVPDNAIQRAAYAVMCAARWSQDDNGWEVTMARDCADSAARCIGMIAAGKTSKAWSEGVVGVSSPEIVADTGRDIARHIAAEAEADMRQWQVDVLKAMIADVYK